MKTTGLLNKPQLERNVRIGVKKLHEANKNLRHLWQLFPLGLALTVLGGLLHHFMPENEKLDVFWAIGLLMISVKAKDFGICLVRGRQLSKSLKTLDKFGGSLEDVEANGSEEDALTLSEKIDLNDILNRS